MPLVGIDLVRVDEVRASLAAHGERYLKRVYTDLERDQSVVHESLDRALERVLVAAGQDALH